MSVMPKYSALGNGDLAPNPPPRALPLDLAGASPQTTSLLFKDCMVPGAVPEDDDEGAALHLRPQVYSSSLTSPYRTMGLFRTLVC